MTYPNYLIQRKNKLKKWLKDHELEGCWIQDPINLYYYTGLHLSAGVLFVGHKKSFLLADRRYSARCKKEAPFDVLEISSFQEALEKLSFPKVVAIDGETLLWNQAELLKKKAKLKNKSGFLKQLRAIKDKNEQDKLRKSCLLSKKSYQYLEKHFKEGVTERELAKRLEMYLLKNGADKLSFDSIVAFGKNSANPHYSPQDVKLKKNDIILVDSGCIIDGYCSDMTRTYLRGKVPKKIEEFYHHVETIQKKAITLCQVGTPLNAVQKAVVDYFKKHGVNDYFLHSLGHGIGIEIHEGPTYSQKDPIEPGMAITVEPGLYLEGVGGIRIEDTLITTSKGPENLTR